MKDNNIRTYIVGAQFNKGFLIRSLRCNILFNLAMIFFQWILYQINNDIALSYEVFMFPNDVNEIISEIFIVYGWGILCVALISFVVALIAHISDVESKRKILINLIGVVNLLGAIIIL